MSDISVLTDARKINGLLKQLNEAQLHALSDKIQARLAALAEEKKKFDDILNFAKERGISTEELVQVLGGSVSAPAAKSGTKAAPKYRMVVDGVEHLWTGRGRAPEVFKTAKANGTLNQYLIG